MQEPPKSLLKVLLFSIMINSKLRDTCCIDSLIYANIQSQNNNIKMLRKGRTWIDITVDIMLVFMCYIAV